MGAADGVFQHWYVAVISLVPLVLFIVIYLDNSATTRIDDSVVEAMLPWLRDNYGNASSIYTLGRKARVAVEDAREEIASLIGAHPAELIFTSGGTESNNSVLKSVALDSALVGTFVHSSIEHHAVLHPAESLAASGVTVREVGVTSQGCVVPDSLAEYNAPRTMVSVMHANNETGAIQPIEEIRSVLTDALLHTDAVQSFGKIPFNTGRLGLDFASLSAHKIHGPKGIGAMFIRRGIDFKAHQQGGGQERNRRGGTEAVALIAGFQMAARNAVAEMDARAATMQARTELLRSLLAREIPNIRLNTPERALPNIVNISFLDAASLDGEAILQAMDMAGIAVSNGSACVSGSLQASHVLLAMGLPAAEARAAIRFSVSKDTTEGHVLTAVGTLAAIVSDMRE